MARCGRTANTAGIAYTMRRQNRFSRKINPIEGYFNAILHMKLSLKKRIRHQKGRMNARLKLRAGANCYCRGIQKPKWTQLKQAIGSRSGQLPLIRNSKPIASKMEFAFEKPKWQHQFAKVSPNLKNSPKISKVHRILPAFVSHGDFRRYLYEALVIPMTCSLGDKKQG